MRKSIYEKYAKLLINYSLELKPEEKLIIRGSYLSAPLIKEAYKEALKVGAYPEIMISIGETSKIYYDYSNEKQLKYISPIQKLAVNEYDAFLNIKSSINLKELQNVDPEKKKIASMAQSEISKIFMKRASEGSLKWSLCEFPTYSQAQESGFSLEEYEDFVFSACFLYEDDPVKKWEQIHDEQERIVQFLNKKKNIRYKTKDTDISFSTEGRIWINSDGKHNMPSGEVFTTPVENSVNGKIRFSYPGIFMGQEIEDISFVVKNGEIIEWNAKKGKKLLDRLFEIPGTKRFGEAAIGTNYGIKKFIKNMLFDEKIGGTIHMAVGASYPETGGKNQSSVHWDLLADMTESGEIYADNELIYKNGKFII